VHSESGFITQIPDVGIFSKLIFNIPLCIYLIIYTGCFKIPTKLNEVFYIKKTSKNVRTNMCPEKLPL
jgi:hypothetical protein